MKTWKTPEILRLSRIEKWVKERFERRMRERDTAAAMRAAVFYAAIACRADGNALDNVSSYR
jgi:hypothetical protein